MKNDNKKTGDKATHTKGLTKKEEVAQNKDEHIDQDFPGYPHSPAGESTINPQTEEEKVNANLKTDNEPAEDRSVGSANAFEATEGGDILREELDDDTTDKKRKNYY